MVTKQQAQTAREFHACVHHMCRRIVGPRGGVRVDVTHVRASGQCKTWSTRPDEFRVPIKHGLYTHASITEGNAAAFHVADACPLTLWGSEEAFVSAVRDLLSGLEGVDVASGTKAWCTIVHDSNMEVVRRLMCAEWIQGCGSRHLTGDVCEVLVNPVPGLVR